MVEMQQKNKVKIFCCYAHKDQKMVEELAKHLSVLKYQYPNIYLSFRDVTERRDWGQRFDSNIEHADIILLLLSPDFMVSNYLHSTDMQSAFDRQERKEASILPVYLRWVDCENSPIGHLQLLPHNGSPVVKWKNRDQAFFDVSEGIKKVINEITQKRIENFSHENKEAQPTEKKDKIIVETALETDSHRLSSTSKRGGREEPDELERISPSIEMPFYLFDQNTERGRKKRGKKPSKKPSPFVQQRPLFNDDFSLTNEQDQISNEKDLNDLEDARSEAQHKLINNQPQEALAILEDVDIGSVPSKQRWRLVAMRGHCYFGLGKFLPARREYNEALQIKPIIVPKEQLHEEGMLYLKNAEANRELGNLPEAEKWYKTALAHTNTHTEIGYLAETHWGLALVCFEQIHANYNKQKDLSAKQKDLLQEAFDHAESARQLYSLAGDNLNVASVTCDIALFEQATGDLENASIHLKQVIETWTPKLLQKGRKTKEDQKRWREHNNIISAASCYLARIEAEMHQYENALRNIKIAQEAANNSYTIRKGEAAMTLGVILEAHHLHDPNAERAFRQAIHALSNTDLLGAQIHAQDLLGQHFLKIGNIEMGEEELNKARKISQTALFSS